MWKPGSSKPKNDTPSEHLSNVPDKISKVGGSAVAVAKKLSSATMGMRFMMRKKDGNRTSSKERKPIASTSATNNNKSERGNNATNNASNENNSAFIDRKRKCDEISHDSPPPSTASSGGGILLDKASIVDMYGLGSDIIGRRSFGGYRKSVMTTWEEALKRRTEDNTRTNNTKHHITDEELLERYEKYVKGRGGERGSSSSSGGSGRKEKRKRNG